MGAGTAPRNAVDLAPLPPPAAGWPLGVGARILSAGEDGGAFAAVLALPAGYQRHAGAITVDSDLLVLSGAVRIGGAPRERGAYEHAPAGSRQEAWSVAERCELLLLARGGRPDFVPHAHAACERAAGHVERDAGTIEWEPRIVAGEPPGVAVRPLREDPATGERVQLTGIVRHWRSDDPPVPHDGPEEGYVISGDLTIGSGDALRAGSFYRRAAGAGEAPRGDGGASATDGGAPRGDGGAPATDGGAPRAGGTPSLADAPYASRAGAVLLSWFGPRREA